MQNILGNLKELINELVQHEKDASRLCMMLIYHADMNDKRNYKPEILDAINLKIGEHQDRANKIKIMLGLQN